MLLVGLGNYGEEYKLHRHNLGFIFIRLFMEQYNFSKVNGNFKGDLYKSLIGGRKIFCLTPNTYMNHSGESVSLVARYYSIKLDDIIVFYDDIDLELGRVKCKKSGSDGGHNGIKNIDKLLGSEYFRVRFGIGRGKFGVNKHVLSNFSAEEMAAVEAGCKNIIKNLELLLNKDIDKFLNNLVVKNESSFKDAK